MEITVLDKKGEKPEAKDSKKKKKLKLKLKKETTKNQEYQ